MILANPQNYTTAQIGIPLHVILFWALLFQVFFCFVKNALIFRELSKEIRIDLLQIEKLKPFGYVAASNSIVILVALALMPLLSMGEPMQWADIIVAIMFVLPLAAAVFYLPIHRISKRVQEAKSLEIEQIHSALSGNKAVLINDTIAYKASDFGLNGLLIWRNEVRHISELPVNFKIFVEIGLNTAAALLISGGSWFFTILNVTISH